MVTKIPLQSDELDKVAQISIDIKSMLKSHPKVFLGKESPYCFLSRVESYFSELSLGCNLMRMVLISFLSIHLCAIDVLTFHYKPTLLSKSIVL